MIDGFVRTTRFRRRFWFTIASLTTHGLFVGVVLYLIDWARPSLHPPALWVGLSWLVVVLAWHLLHPGLSLRAADGTLGLQDRLLTWWSLRDRDPDAAILWLEDDLSDSLADLPPRARTQLWRRPARRLLWALPLLLVVWIIGPIGRQHFLPSPIGVTEPGAAGPTGKAGAGDGQPDVAGRPDPDRRQPGKPDPDRLSPPQPQRPDPDRPSKGDRGSQPPPKPVLPLPGTEEFVIPAFVGEGDGEKRKARIAVLEENRRDQATGAGTQAARPGANRAAEQQQERQREYQRAEERALRSRHVPLREREFVKRYFAELLGGGGATRVLRTPR